MSQKTSQFVPPENRFRSGIMLQASGFLRVEGSREVSLFPAERSEVVSGAKAPRQDMVHSRVVLGE